MLLFQGHLELWLSELDTNVTKSVKNAIMDAFRDYAPKGGRLIWAAVSEIDVMHLFNMCIPPEMAESSGALCQSNRLDIGRRSQPPMWS